MNRRRFLAAITPMALVLPARAQLEELLDAGRQLLEENLDPELLRALEAGDLARVEGFLNDAILRFQGEYVLDLAQLRDTAGIALQLLEAHPETRSYASWLRSRMDYFDVADDLERALPATKPAGATAERPAPRPIPTPEQQRKAWKQKSERRPVPRQATDWVPRLKPVFRQAGAPPALVWLAEIESSFDPRARSPVGAAGLYQLMPETARGLGLKLKPTDERLVPEKNARAAATYLRQLHRQFKDWRLALAAYNAGPGRISQLLKRRRAQSFDAIAPSLPAETQMYVPKFETVLRKREGVALSSLQLPVKA
jgi:membrane-bound lytic murein transglycosylase D